MQLFLGFNRHTLPLARHTTLPSCLIKIGCYRAFGPYGIISRQGWGGIQLSDRCVCNLEQRSTCFSWVCRALTFTMDMFLGEHEQLGFQWGLAFVLLLFLSSIPTNSYHLCSQHQQNRTFIFLITTDIFELQPATGHFILKQQCLNNF